MNFWRGVATGAFIGVAAVMLFTDDKKRKEITAIARERVAGARANRVLRGVRRTVRDLVEE